MYFNEGLTWSPLQFAVRANSELLYKFILDKIEIGGRFLQTSDPLELAVENQNLQIIMTIWPFVFIKNPKNGKGQTLLHATAKMWKRYI